MLRRLRFGLTAVFLALVVMFSSVAQAKSIELRNVKRIYIERMPNNLDEYLGSAISSQFHGNVEVVMDRSHADAILTGENINAQDTQHSTVRLLDKRKKTVLWSGTAGDRSLKTLAINHGGQKTIADNLMAELHKAMTR